MSRRIAVAALLLACSLPAAAQTTYASSGDTLRFRDVTQGKVVITTPQGELPITVEQRSTVSIVRMRGDSARAWYDSLFVAATSAAGDQRPATDSALKQPFRLGFGSRGQIKLVQAPKFPVSLEGITDLPHQFDDFFLRLPAKPLVVGLAWSDTTVRSDSTADKYSRRATTADYRVERDTVAGGTPALIVSMKQRIVINEEGPVPNQAGMRATSQLQGTDDGYFVFAPKPGRLLSRRRTGKLEGDTALHAAAGEMTMKQAISYTATLDALR
ncbi:MAG: hypothetical protein ABI601_09395 [bacterium]